MKSMRVAGVALATSVSTLLGCSSADTVVAANVQSSNDTPYNGTTSNGKNGGLVEPGIPDGILDHDSTTPNELRKVDLVRITVSQAGQTPISHEVVPAKASIGAFDVLGPDGMPELDAERKPVKLTHYAIGPFYNRFVLPSGWKGQQSEIFAEALDSAGDVLLTSATLKFDVVEEEVVYAPVDLQIPAPPEPEPEPGAGGAGAGGEPGTGTAEGGAPAGSGGSGGAASDAGAGGA